MLYLFNSAFRPLYLANILKTIALPLGSINEYRYRCSGEGSIHVPDTEIPRMLSASKGLPAVITFIDRFSEGGYRYFPIRQAELLNAKVEGERIYFKVKLGRLAFPENIGSAQEKLIDGLEKLGLPKLTNNDPQETNDGHYAILSDHACLGEADYRYDASAFSAISNALNGTQAFVAKKPIINGAQTATKGVAPIFVRMSVLQGRREIIPKIEEDDDAYFQIQEGSSYKLKLSYYFQAHHDGGNADAYVDFGDTLRSNGSNQIRFDSYNNLVEVPFSVVKDSIDQEDGISFSFESKNQSFDVLAPDEVNLPVRIKERRGFWFFFVLIIFVYAAVELLKSSAPEMTREVIQSNWPVFVFSLIQAVVIFFGLRWTGWDVR